MSATLHYDLAQEAARVMCEERLTDYRTAKQKAAQRLGLSSRAAMPDNAQVERAVIEYQRLFGGAAYTEHLAKLRRTAVSAMRLLAEFEPKLVGAAVSGAVNTAHRVQLHAFADRAERLDLFLHDRGIAFEPGERSYRYRDGREEKVPLVRFDAEGVGVDVAVFEADDRRVPVNPADGKAYRRLDLEAAQKLS